MCCSAVSTPTPVRRNDEALLLVVALAAAVAAGRGLESLAHDRPGSQARDVARVLVGIAPADQLRAATDTPAELGHLSGRDRPCAGWPDACIQRRPGDRQHLYARALDQLDVYRYQGRTVRRTHSCRPTAMGRFLGERRAQEGPPERRRANDVVRDHGGVRRERGSNDVILFARESGGLWQVPAWAARHGRHGG